MKKILRILGCFLAFGVLPLRVGAVDLDVNVRTPSNVAVAGVQVFAVRFTTAGVDNALTRTAVTDVAGLAQFASLTVNVLYDILASTQGYRPSLNDQFNNPDHPRFSTSAAVASPITITLSSAGAANLGEIWVDVENASTATFVMGEVRYASGVNRNVVARGFVKTSAVDGVAGHATRFIAAGPLKIFNVPFASTSAYTIAGLDTAKNVTYSFPGDRELAAYRKLIRYTSGGTETWDSNNLLQFGNAIPIQNTQNATQQYKVTGSVNVEGVVIDTTSAQTPIPHIGVNFAYRSNYSYCSGSCMENVWSHTDDNGRFQLFGLQLNTTYYAQIYGGCNWMNNTCYEGSNSTWTAYTPSTSAPIGLNDFYYAGVPFIKKIKLNTSAGGSGTIAVYVKNSLGQFLPQSGVNLWSDGRGWRTGGTDCATSSRTNNPGLANFHGQATTGYILIPNLPAGNYSLQAWTQFSNQGGTSYNAGADGKDKWDGDNCGSDDLRVTIDTTTTPNVRVFNSSGVSVSGGAAVSSITIVVPLTTNLTGLVKGTLTFPGVVNLSADPINITLQVQCNSNCSGGGGGFTVIDYVSTGPTVSYSVSVASGQAYWMNVTSGYWGRVGHGDNGQISLKSTGTAIVNMTFAPAGRLIGKLFKPDTSLFQPTFGNNNSVSANINADGDQSWGWGQLNQDGSFALGGLLPGSYKLRVQSWGGQFPYADPEPIPTETVFAGRDTYRDLSLVDGVALKIVASTMSLPAMNKIVCPTEGDTWNCPPETWTVVPVPQGTDFSQRIGAILSGDDYHAEIGYAATISTSGGSSPCNGPVSEIGFCVKRVASPATRDFYLLRKGQFDDVPHDRVRPYFVILSSTKNVTIKSGLATDLYYQNQSTITVQTVNLTPVPPLSSAAATLRGSVIGANFIRQQDFESFGGNFSNFIKYIPLLSLFDSSGTLRAAGLVVPDPTCFAQGALGAQFDQAIAEGNWTLFKSIFDSCLPAPGYASFWGFEVRGLAPGQTYEAVLTSPNYPSYQAPVTLGVAGTTTTLNINLDLSVGSGATLTGVVASTNGVVIANASVSIKARGFNNNKKRTVTTNSAGVYRVEGLPPGTYGIGVVADGYALAKKIADISGTSSFTVDFAMRKAGAMIMGTVRSSPFNTLEDVRVFAYNDTENVNSPAAELSLYQTVTSSLGFYSIDGLVVGEKYKVFFKAPGYYIANVTTPTVNGVVSGVDFQLRPKPLDVEVFAHRGSTDYEFTVLNPDNFPDGKARISESPYVLAGSTDVGNSFQTITSPAGDNLLLKYPLTQLNPDGRNYVLHIEATDPSSSEGAIITKEVVFGLSRQGGAAQSIDDALLGDDEPDAQGRQGNDAALDVGGGESANNSALTFPAGALIPFSTYTIPSCNFSHVSRGTSPAAAVLSSTAAFASDVYTVEIGSVSINDKGFDLTLGYDKKGADISDLAVHKFNDAAQKWEVVPGLQTIDPLKGTVTIKRIRSLASVLGLKSGHPMKSLSSGGTYTPNAYKPLAVTDSGSYAVMRPSLLGIPYTGTTIRVYNFPNPFNLTTKTSTLVHAQAGQTSLTTAGTVIKYELPSNISGHVYIRIYTLAGELVQEFDQGEQSGGFYYYTAWDGKNKYGAEVANGVYYGIVSVPGANLRDSTFKMAVIK